METRRGRVHCLHALRLFRLAACAVEKRASSELQTAFLSDVEHIHAYQRDQEVSNCPTTAIVHVCQVAAQGAFDVMAFVPLTTDFNAVALNK